MNADDLPKLSVRTLLPLLRARPPHKDLGAFLRLSRDAMVREASATTDPVERFVRFAQRQDARGPIALGEVEVTLVRATYEWTVDQIGDAVAQLAAAWPNPTGGRRRILDRLTVLQSLVALRDSERIHLGAFKHLAYALSTWRAPLWSDLAPVALVHTQPRPTAQQLEHAIGVVRAEAPAAYAAVAPQLASLRRILLELPAEGEE